MNKQKFVYQTVAEYSARLGIPAPDVSIVGVDPDAKHMIGRSAWGCAYRGSHRIIIRTHGRQLKGIRRTIVHELIHLAFPKLQHGARYEQYIQAVLSGNIAFDGNGLITKVTKPAPTLSDEMLKLTDRQKRIDTKIKRLTTARKKIVRRLNFLKRKTGEDQ